MLAAETCNKVPKSSSVLRAAFRSHFDEVTIEKCIKEIQQNFPKFKEAKGFYRFGEWSKRHNWVVARERPGNSLGLPKEPLDKIRLDKIRKEYIIAKNWEGLQLLPDDYARINKAIKTLVYKAGTDETAIEAIQWITKDASDRYDWTLETLINKKWPDFLKNGKRSDAYKEMKAHVKR